MESIGALPYIDFVVGADSVGNSKPAPDMIEKICSFLGKDPGKSILIGDTVMDALLGRNSGTMLTIGVKGIVPGRACKVYGCGGIQPRGHFLSFPDFFRLAHGFVPGAGFSYPGLRIPSKPLQERS